MSGVRADGRGGKSPRHSFAVCAYGESPYLEACIRSLKAQTAGSEILVCTSTPNEHIRRLAGRYGLPLRVRDGAPGIGPDWNFAFREASGEFVTLAHQDDLYEKHYTERLLAAADRWPDMVLFISSAVTIRNGAPQKHPGLPETVKKLLRIPLRFHGAADRTWVKRLALRLGNPVICPSAGYRKEAVLRWSGESGPFPENRKFILDWEFLYDFAAAGGRWISEERPLMFYRVHGGAATAACITDHVREREEAEMFRRLWPSAAAKLILRFYRRSYEAYD